MRLGVSQKTVIALICAVSIASPLSYAEPTNQELLNVIKDLRSLVESQNRRIEALESKAVVADEIRKSQPLTEEVREHIEKRFLDDSEGRQFIGGLKMEVGATMVGQQAFNINKEADKKGERSNDLAYSVDIVLEKEFDDFGRAFLHLEAGDGLAGDRRTGVFSSLNRDANDSDNAVNVTESFYEQYLLCKQAGIRFGKLDPTASMDQNEYANDETTQFLSSIFRNSPAIDFPDNSLGAAFYVEPTAASWVALSGGYIDGDSDGDSYTSTGFMFGQVNFKPTLLGEDKPSNYRFYTWKNKSSHANWSGDPERGSRPGYGFGASFDQKVSENIGLFARYGWQDARVYLVENAWSVGASVSGAKWDRKNDNLGIAFGQAYSGKDWRNEGSATGTSADRLSKKESHLEIYYNYQVNNYLTLSPNFQWIVNPYGRNEAATKDIGFSSESLYLAGVRAQVDF